MAHSARSVIGTRGSPLALAQAHETQDRLAAALGLDLVALPLSVIKTTGDAIQDRPLSEAGGKGLFTKELEQALLAGQIDFAVHSFKDVPVTMPLVETADLVMAAVPERENPFDVLVCEKARRLGDLPPGAGVGTGSLRRRSQVLAARPDLVVEGIRGNIDTRLRKLREGQFDAVILAAAGLRRAGLFDAGYMTLLDDPAVMLPAPGQGALVLQCRRDDHRTGGLLGALDHPPTAACVAAERSLVEKLQGDCHSPIAALARIKPAEPGGGGEELTLRAAVGARDGQPPVLRAEATGAAGAADDVVAAVFDQLARGGVRSLLSGGTSG